MGCYVSGLYLEGAAWDHEASKLKRQAPRQTVDELPILQVIDVCAAATSVVNSSQSVSVSHHLCLCA